MVFGPFTPFIVCRLVRGQTWKRIRLLILKMDMAVRCARENIMSDAKEMESEESFADLLAQHEAVRPKLQTGQKVSGTVIAISGDSVFVDVGLKQDGVMDRADILDAEGNETVKQGDAVEAWVVSLSPQGIRLSRSMIGSGIAALEEARDAQIPVDGRVRAVCKGGYQVDVLGKTAFCPGSQMENFGETAPEDIVGRQMQFLITRIENHGRNIVVSRRALMEKERREHLDKLLSSIKVGDTVEGRVSRLAPFGAFVELAPFVEGLVHISEISWSRVVNADEALSLDDAVRVKITGIGKDEKGQTRISLSIKQAQGDPWLDVADRFAIGDTVAGKVTRLAPFGAFIEIAPGIEGLAHISEFSWEKRIVKPEDFLASGERVNVKIRELNPDSRRISLSIRDAQGDPWEDAATRFAAGVSVAGKVESNSPHGLFVSLAPGVTGLVPKGALDGKLAKLGQGADLDVTVKSIDAAARRISLIPARTGGDAAPTEKDWRGHIKAGGSDGMGIMAQALRKAMQKK